MSKKVGVVLSGCGYLDGSEIHESVLTLLHLDRAGAGARENARQVGQVRVVPNDHHFRRVAVVAQILPRSPS